MSSTPVRVKKNGAWTPIDLTLVETDGVVRPKASLGDLILSAGGDTTAARFTDVTGATAVGAPATLPKPVLKGNTATYSDAYGPGSDLVVTLTPSGFRHDVLIRRRPGKDVQLRVPMRLPKGIKLGTGADRTPGLLDAKGKEVDDLTAPMLDAAALLEPDKGAIGQAKAEVDGDSVVYTAPAAFLDDPATVYPVTVTTMSETWEGTGIAGDTHVSNVLPDGSANATLPWLLAGKSHSGSRTHRTYINFHIKGTPLEGGTVHNADLRLHNQDSHTCSDTDSPGIDLQRVTSPWSTSTISWNNQPSTVLSGHVANRGAYSATRCPEGEGELYYSIELIVQAWMNGTPDLGVRLNSVIEPDSPQNWRYYRSDEYGGYDTYPFTPRGPVLFIEYTPLPAGPPEVVVYSYEGPKRPQPATYEQAVAMRVDSDDIPYVPPMSDEQEQALSATPNHVAEVAPEELEPFTGESGEESWDGGTVEEGSPPDDIAPTIVSTTPVADAAQVPTDTAIKATFNEPVWEPDFVLKDPSGTAVEGAVTVDGSQKEFTFTPAQPLKPAVRYTAEIAEAIDASANPMTAYPWAFETASAGSARWTFDEGTGKTAADTYGRHPATLNDTAAWTPGKNGNALTNQPSPARVAASREATRQKGTVEVVDETTATNVTYALPDGSFRREISSGPVRTRQGGAWVPIDTRLARHGEVLRPKAPASGVSVEVSTGGSGAFARMTTGDGKSYALRWPAALPEPAVNGGTATFADAAGKGADLVVTVLPTGFRHDVVVRERPGEPLEIRMGVETSGLSLSADKSGRLLLKGPDKKVVAAAARPVMWDGSDQGRPHRARRAGIDTSVVTKGGETELVLKPDHAFLTDPSTVLPVRVDPTITLPLNADVEVGSDFPTDPADPGTPYLTAGRLIDGLYRPHLRFDTTGLAGQTVTDAKLSLVNVDAPACGGSVGAGIQVRRLTGAWSADSLTWGRKPAATTEDAQISKTAVNSDCATFPGAMEWTVTGIAQDWAAGAANHGLVLMHPNEAGTADNYRVFTSAENTEFADPAPKLTVTIGAATSNPSASALAITPAQIVNGVTVATSLTPQLGATVADTVGGTLTGEFEIEHDPAAPGQGVGQIWAGASPAVASGSRAGVTVPAGKLVDGWKTRWRARAVNAGASTASAWSAWQNVTVDVPDTQPDPAVGALQVVPSHQADGTTVTTSRTPNLLAQVTDPAGGALRAEFELEHDPAATGQGTGTIWTGAADNVTSGSQAGVTVPDGRLSDGWKVRWRARAVAGQRTSAWSGWQSLTVDVVAAGEEPLARTAGPVIRTDQSFTVASWLRWSDKDGDYLVAEQRGGRQAPFRLGNTPDRGLVFTLTSGDTADATSSGVLSDVEAPVNEWFHLAGVYDATAGTAALYLNGQLVTSAPVGFQAWNGTGPLTLGTRMRGDLDEARTYQRLLTATEIGALAGGTGTAPAARATARATQPAQQNEPDPYEVNYRHYTLNTCRAKAPTDGRLGIWTDATVFSGCSVRWFGLSTWLDDWDPDSGTRKKIRVKLPDGSAGIDLMMRATTVINTYLGTRDGTGIRNAGSDGTTGPITPTEFSMWVGIDEAQYALESGFGNARMQLTTTTESSSGSSPCAKTIDGDREARIKDWNGTTQYFRFKSSSTVDAVRRCTIVPWMKIKDVIAVKPWPTNVPLWGKLKDEQGTLRTPPTVRCDDLTLGPGSPGAWPEEKRVRYKGACIFPDVSRIYRTDVDHAKRGPVAAHIWAAFNTPDLTNPKKPAGQKVVPGNWDGSTARSRSPLTRINESELRPLDPKGRTWGAVQVSERRKACKTPKVVGDCDEFPFNSVKEGPGWGDGNFSVRGVPASNNKSDGWYLSVFYARYRVLVPDGNVRPNGDRFWVSVKGTPPS
ncbi:DNRLRE domain-containing protein [Nonomuraea sp. NPDC050547]|uniref:DNRLRE domain-containing protein n=1 Tax=Nonomuraea sp. NPDC050547 TaxID=3364368 RepID=UPI0037B32151